jgi:ribosome biogenesis GTPase
VFSDVEALAARCRFSDCSHRAEPGCAVAGAIAEGTLPEARLAGMEKLAREEAVTATRRSARARSERQAQNKRANRALRRRYREQNRG